MFLKGKLLSRASLREETETQMLFPMIFPASQIVGDLTVVNFCALTMMTVISPVFLKTRFMQRSVKASPPIDPALGEKKSLYCQSVAMSLYELR